MQFGDMSSEGRRNVDLALILMEHATPAEFEWLRSLGPIIGAEGGGCGCNETTIACTWIQPNEQIKIEFHRDPTGMSVPEIATTLRHEARHYALAQEPGYAIEVPHNCSDGGCQNRFERAMDPIYRRDPAFRRKYGGHWLLHGPRLELAYDYRKRQERALEERARADTIKAALGFSAATAGLLLLARAIAAATK